MLLGPHGLFEIIEVEAKQSRAKGATLLHPHDRLEGSRLAMRRVDYHRSGGWRDLASAADDAGAKPLCLA